MASEVLRSPLIIVWDRYGVTAMRPTQSKFGIVKTRSFSVLWVVLWALKEALIAFFHGSRLIGDFRMRIRVNKAITVKPQLGSKNHFVLFFRKSTKTRVVKLWWKVPNFESNPGFSRYALAQGFWQQRRALSVSMILGDLVEEKLSFSLYLTKWKGPQQQFLPSFSSKCQNLKKSTTTWRKICRCVNGENFQSIDF